MYGQTDLQGLISEFRDGKSAGKGWGALARAITRVENSPPWQVELPTPPEPVQVVGITGPPGAGKSTLTGRLIEAYAEAGSRVAVLAIDPSSPISGGAVLGDRLRMETHLMGREDVFVRSLASRGSHGAIAGATRNVARLLELSGSFDVILIETVGAGQTEVAIAELADTIALVTVPGLGDAVQAIKAGLMEVADMVVVNMADRPGAPETVRHLRLSMGRDFFVTTTIATEGIGVPELRDALEQRWSRLQDGEGLEQLRARKRAREAALVAEAWVRSCADERAEETLDLNSAVKRILEEAAQRWTI
ncbi:MAG TPA: GTP-binding protein [Solirubrobacterales bacterium]|nr:GTP-binding protein [Solirubrobacterales bacterium]